MENNVEPQIRQELSPLVTPEKSSRPEQFFDEMQESIDAGEALLKNGEQSANPSLLEERGVELDLTQEEVKGVLEDGGFAERLSALNEKARKVYGDFLERARKIGAVTTTALVLGATSPAYSFAEEQVVEPSSSDQTVNEFGHVAQVEKKEALPTYDQAMKKLHESVMTDTNEKMLISVKEEDGVWKPVALIEGNKTSIASSEEETDAREKGEEIEEVHTHPLEVSTFSGLLSPEEIVKVREGNGIARVMPPSGDGDFIAVIQKNILARVNGARIHYKVVEPTGEWSFEIADQDSPFIKLMSKILSLSQLKAEDLKKEVSPEEKEYIVNLQKEFPDQRIFAREMEARAGSGGVAKSAWDKFYGAFNGTLSRVFDTASKDEQASNKVFGQYLEGNYLHTAGATNEQKNKEDIEFYETTAKKLGFSLKYTPNKKAE